MINKETTAMVTDHFNDEYFDLHQFLLKEGDNTASRNGATVELLNFKTIVKNPIKRCVGGYKRNINIFFLLAEALWIACGKRDVEFLDTYNGQLKQYSDNGSWYHAPYGWRLRKWGVDSMADMNEENNHAMFQGKIDQLRIAVEALEKNPEDRRVVLAIWNPEYDLGKTSQDLPCNDLLMYKIRHGKLYTTIANRSNDLNLGLTTNVFQFSFLSEIVAKILGVGLGDQVHNSQSLHLYMNNNMTTDLCLNIDKKYGDKKLYDIAKPMDMDFNFGDKHSAGEKLRLIDFHIDSIVHILQRRKNSNIKSHPEYEDQLKDFSRYLYFVYELLGVYVDYKRNSDKKAAIEELLTLCDEMPEFATSDYMVLAMNFFFSRMKVTDDMVGFKALKAKYHLGDF